MDLRLANKSVLITGASAGLGLATAQQVNAEGGNPLLVSRSPSSLEAARETLAHPETAAICATDLATEDSWERITSVRNSFDAAFISVGGPPPGLALQVSDEQWRESFDTVFLGALRLVRALVASWQSAGGNQDRSIVLVLSTTVKVPLAPLAISNGLRPGLGILVNDIAHQVGTSGIRINGLMPGRIATDRLAQIDALAGTPEETRKANEAQLPMGRYGEPSEFADVATFLLSPRSSYVSGAVIPVDGAMMPTI